MGEGGRVGGEDSPPRNSSKDIDALRAAVGLVAQSDSDEESLGGELGAGAGRGVGLEREAPSGRRLVAPGSGLSGSDPFATGAVDRGNKSLVRSQRLQRLPGVVRALTMQVPRDGRDGQDDDSGGRVPSSRSMSQGSFSRPLSSSGGRGKGRSFVFSEDIELSNGRDSTPSETATRERSPRLGLGVFDLSTPTGQASNQPANSSSKRTVRRQPRDSDVAPRHRRRPTSAVIADIAGIAASQWGDRSAGSPADLAPVGGTPATPQGSGSIIMASDRSPPSNSEGHEFARGKAQQQGAKLRWGKYKNELGASDEAADEGMGSLTQI